MSERRLEACEAIEPGEFELGLDGRRVRLVRVVLTDAGALRRDDGRAYRRPDVVCPLCPVAAREPGLRLSELAHEARTARL
jgi:hypothetical protein